MGPTTRPAGYQIGVVKRRVEPLNVADHHLQWLTRGSRNRFPHWLTDGQDGNWSEMMSEI